MTDDLTLLDSINSEQADIINDFELLKTKYPAHLEEIEEMQQQHAKVFAEFDEFAKRVQEENR